MSETPEDLITPDDPNWLGTLIVGGGFYRIARDWTEDEIIEDLGRYPGGLSSRDERQLRPRIRRILEGSGSVPQADVPHADEVQPPGGLMRDEIIAARRAWLNDSQASPAVWRRLGTSDATLTRARRFYGLVPWPPELRTRVKVS